MDFGGHRDFFGGFWIIIQDCFTIKDCSYIKSFIFAMWQHYSGRRFEISDCFYKYQAYIKSYYNYYNSCSCCCSSSGSIMQKMQIKYITERQINAYRGVNSGGRGDLGPQYLDVFCWEAEVPILSLWYYYQGKAEKKPKELSRLPAVLSFHQKCSVRLKMHQIYFRPGLRPELRWGSLRRGCGGDAPSLLSTPLDAYGVSFSAPVAPLPSGLPNTDDG